MVTNPKSYAVLTGGHFVFVQPMTMEAAAAAEEWVSPRSAPARSYNVISTFTSPLVHVSVCISGSILVLFHAPGRYVFGRRIFSAVRKFRGVWATSNALVFSKKYWLFKLN